MTTFITYKLFSSRTGQYGHCFMVVETYVMRGAEIIGSSQAVMHGDDRWNRESILKQFRKFLHEDDKGARRDVWAFNSVDGAVMTVEKVWNE